jgi:hypothetical protein
MTVLLLMFIKGNFQTTVIVDENPGRQQNFVAAKTDHKPVCSVQFENVYSMDMTSWSKNEHVCQECKTFVKATLQQ